MQQVKFCKGSLQLPRASCLDVQVFAVTSPNDEKQAAVWHNFEFGATRRYQRRSSKERKAANNAMQTFAIP